MASPDTQPPEKSAAHWLKANWQLVVACLGLLSAGVTALRTDAATSTKFEDRLAAVEAGIQRGEARDTETTAAVQRNGASIDAAKLHMTEMEGATRRTDAHNADTFQMFSKNFSDLGARNEAIDQRYSDLRHARDVELAAIMQRVAVLEAQLQFFGRHVDPSPRSPPPSLPGKRP